MTQNMQHLQVWHSLKTLAGLTKDPEYGVPAGVAQSQIRPLAD